QRRQRAVTVPALGRTGGRRKQIGSHGGRRAGGTAGRAMGSRRRTGRDIYVVGIFPSGVRFVGCGLVLIDGIVIVQHVLSFVAGVAARGAKFGRSPSAGAPVRSEVFGPWP